MKNRLLLVLCLLFGLPALLTAQYDIWLLRVGDGTIEGMTTPQAFALQKVQISGDSATLLETFDAPSTDPATLITGVPSYATDGQLSMSHDGRFLVFTGYGALVGQTGSIAGADAAVVNRVVARFNTLTGDFDTTTRLTNSFNRSNMRGGTTYDGTGFWLTGNGNETPNSGLRYAEFGSSESVTVLSGNYSTTDAVIFNENVYYSRSTGTGPEDSTNSGILLSGRLPKIEKETGSASGKRLPSLDWENGAGYMSFRFSPDGTALFVASRGGGVDTTPGLLVFRYDEGEELWNLTSELPAADLRHIELFDADGDQVRVFYVRRATSGAFESTLSSVYYDLGTDEFTAPVELLAAESGYVFYGVAGTDNPPTLDENMPLTILSSVSGTNPEVGAYFYSAGTQVTVSAPLNATADNGIAYELVGWSADGSAPASGTGNTITFTLNEPTTVEWLWQQVSAPIQPIVGWNLRGVPTTAVAERPATDVAEGVEQLYLSRGPELILSNLNEGFSAGNFNTGDNVTREAAIARGDYLQFGFTVEEGYQAFVSGLDASFRRSGADAPLHLEWQYSLDGFATAGIPIVPTGKKWDEMGWSPNGSVWRSTASQVFWEGAGFIYLGRNSVGDTTVYRNVAVDYNYMTRDVTEQGLVNLPGNAMPTIDLRGVSGLQGIPAGTTVTFRLYIWGNDKTTASNSFAFGRQDGPVVSGVVAPLNRLPVTVVNPVGESKVEFYAPGTEVTVEVPETVHGADGVRHQLLGFEGSGSAPASGTSNRIVFNLNQATTVEWLWEEQNRLDVAAEGDGKVDLEIRKILPEPLIGFDFGELVREDHPAQYSGLPARTYGSQVEQSVIVRGPGLGVRVLGSGGLSSELWDGVASLEEAVQQGKYYGFTVTPKAGQTVQLMALYVPFRFTATAPHTVALTYSTDGFSTYSVADTRQIHDQASGTSTTRQLFVLPDDPALLRASSPVEFRLYGIGGTSAGGTLALFNDRGYLSDDMILFAGSNQLDSVVAATAKEIWLDVNARVQADAKASSGAIFAGWSGDFLGNFPTLKGIGMGAPVAMTAHFEADSVGDGIPDWWKLHYFGDLTPGAGDDPDNDGFTNLEEYQRGTDPTVFNDALALDTIPFSRWENVQRDHLLAGNWRIHDFGQGYRGALESSNHNRSALNPFHPKGESVSALEGVSFDGPRMIIRKEYWDESWADGTYETVLSVGDDDGNSFYFRYQDELNWYRVTLTGEFNNAPNRPQFGIQAQKRVNGQYHDLYVYDSGIATDPTDTQYYKRVKVRITAEGSNFYIEAFGWDAYNQPAAWASPGQPGYTSTYAYDSDLDHGRAGIGTWAQGGGFQNSGPDWNPVNVGTLFESFTIEKDNAVVFTEDWSGQPLANALPSGWTNAFESDEALAGTWRNSAHGTIAQVAEHGKSTSASRIRLAADADGPTLLAPGFDSVNYLLELGFHPFNTGSVGFVFDYENANNYGRVLFTNVSENRDGAMPAGVVISRKVKGKWTNLTIGDPSFVPTLGQPFVATLSRTGTAYVLNVQEVDNPVPLHRWVWEDALAPAAGGRYGFTTWQTTNAHFLFADAYGVAAVSDDSGLAVLAIEKVGDTIVLTIDNPSGAPYDVQRTTDLGSGNWTTVDEDQTGATWSGPIPAGADRAFWRLVR